MSTVNDGNLCSYSFKSKRTCIRSTQSEIDLKNAIKVFEPPEYSVEVMV